jgi:hypothetical protein
MREIIKGRYCEFCFPINDPCGDYAVALVDGVAACSDHEDAIRGFVANQKLQTTDRARLALFDELVAAMESCLAKQDCVCEWCAMSRSLLTKASELEASRQAGE